MTKIHRWFAGLALLIGLSATPVLASDIYDWSVVAADNDDADSSINFLEGQTPGSVNNSARAMMVRVKQFLNDIGGLGTVGGTADAITLTGTIDALESGKVVAFKAGGTNTTAVTINVNSLGAKAIRRQGDTALSAGDLLSGGVYLLRYDTAYNSSAGAWVLLNPQYAATNLTQGQHTIWVPAGSMVARVTNGPASATAETSTNDVMYRTLNYDATTAECAQFMIQMPKSWNEGTVIAQFVWTHGSTVTNFGVVWSLAGVAFADSDALDTAFGTAVTATDTGGTTDDVFISPETNAITIAGTPSAEELVAFNACRAPSDGSDTMAVDAKLIGLKLHYTSDAATDD